MRHHNMRLGLGAALALMGGTAATETQEPTPEANKEADELAREIEAQRQREQEQRQEFDRLMLRMQAHKTIHIQPAWARSRVRGEPRRRSKRAQRARERGW